MFSFPIRPLRIKVYLSCIFPLYTLLSQYRLQYISSLHFSLYAHVIFVRFALVASYVAAQVVVPESRPVLAVRLGGRWSILLSFAIPPSFLLVLYEEMRAFILLLFFPILSLFHQLLLVTLTGELYEIKDSSSFSIYLFHRSSTRYMTSVNSLA